MLLAQPAVDLDEAVINLRVVADQPVGGHQTAEAMPERRARWQIFRLVNQDAGDAAVLVQQAAQLLQHLLIGEFLAPRQDDLPRLAERVPAQRCPQRRHRRESTGRAD